MIALALAAAIQIGANAPQALRDCPKPIVTERFATKASPNYAYASHIMRTPVETCIGIGPLSSFAERSEPAEFTPVPEALETLAAAAEPIAEPLADDPAPWSAAPFAAAFNDVPVLYVQIPAAPEPMPAILILMGLGAMGLVHGRSKA